MAQAIDIGPEQLVNLRGRANWANGPLGSWTPRSKKMPRCTVTRILKQKPISAQDHPSLVSSSPNLSLTFRLENVKAIVTAKPTSIPANTASPRRPFQWRPSQTAGAT